ncbi:hypothetical protein BY996DRAFT_6428623 [Phakopsora pachyrhizi]|nr:hypothetical protein BY996DRAFT_6428623 [Phakopsora pachyrhizi]
MLKEISLFFAVYVFFTHSALAENWITCSESLEYHPNSGQWYCGGLHKLGTINEIVTFNSILGACVDITSKKRVPTKSFVSTKSRGVKSEFQCKKESNIGNIMKWGLIVDKINCHV